MSSVRIRLAPPCSGIQRDYVFEKETKVSEIVKMGVNARSRIIRVLASLARVLSLTNSAFRIASSAEGGRFVRRA